jgi:hypothetical protein
VPTAETAALSLSFDSTAFSIQSKVEAKRSDRHAPVKVAALRLDLSKKVLFF